MFDDLVGIPYKEAGRGLDGMDCWGLVIECCRRIGIPLDDTQGWTNQEIAQAQQEGMPADDWIQFRFHEWQRVDVAERGCVVAFQNIDGAAVHIGFVVEFGHFLHMSKKMGAIRTRLSRFPFPDSLCGIYAYTKRPTHDGI